MGIIKKFLSLFQNTGKKSHTWGDVLRALSNDGVVVFTGWNGVEQIACGKWALEVGIEIIMWNHKGVLQVFDNPSDGVAFIREYKEVLKSRKRNKTNKRNMSEVCRYIDTVGRKLSYWN